MLVKEKCKQTTIKTYERSLFTCRYTSNKTGKNALVKIMPKYLMHIKHSNICTI